MSLRGIFSGGNDGTSTTGATATVALPAGCQVGDFALIVSSANLGSATATMPAGWTASGGDSNAGVIKSYIFTKTLTSGDISTGSFTVTWSSSGRVIASGVVLYGLDATTPIEGISAVSMTTTVPTVTTTVDGSDVLLVSCARNTGTTAPISTYPAGYTKAADAITTFPSGVDEANSLALLSTPGAAGPYGGGTMSYSPAATHENVYAIATRAAATAGPPNSGSASGTLSWVGSATGSRVAAGLAAGAIAFAGVATGSAVHQGDAAGALAWSGAASGQRTSQGAATGTLAWAGSASGTAPTVGAASGSATGTITWAGAASGTAPTVGMASGSASGTLAWAGTAAGSRTSQGTGSGTLAWTGSATGTAPVVGSASGSATGTVVWAGVATGQAPAIGVNQGSASGTIAWAGIATGTTSRAGDATGTLTWAGAATGSTDAQGDATGTLAWAGVAVGAAPNPNDGTAVHGPTLALTRPAAALTIARPTPRLELNVSDFTVGDTAPPLSGTLNADLTGATLAVHIRKPDQSVLTLNATATDAVNGAWEAAAWGPADIDQAGTHPTEVQVTYSDATVQTFAEDAQGKAITFYVRGQIA